jgi:hypothetical protein
MRTQLVQLAPSSQCTRFRDPPSHHTHVAIQHTVHVHVRPSSSNPSPGRRGAKIPLTLRMGAIAASTMGKAGMPTCGRVCRLRRKVGTGTVQYTISERRQGRQPVIVNYVEGRSKAPFRPTSSWDGSDGEDIVNSLSSNLVGPAEV